ncbi:hypothetical protein C4585_02940 [Candidatus Parcubacteria bacterium]|nr:MAG: hypothetical protein C4585_02940 [Candidatus Parcubacteria bacterium]
MFVKILLIVGVFIAISLLLFWIIGGGIARTIEQARSSTDSSTGTPFGIIRLPWQPDTLSYGPDVAKLLGEGGSTSYGSEGGEDLQSLENEYEQLQKDAEAAKNFGTPSPHRGTVRIYQDNAVESSPNLEYVTLSAGWNNSSSIDITGWSLQSALSGVRAFIPRGASLFILGTVNTQTNIQLSPGDSVVVSSGNSPLGTSFRENLCTGYLNQFQTFTPRLPERCPQSHESVSLTAENLQAYGEACIDFARSLPACVAPLNDFPANSSPQCVNFVASKLSYNGCVDTYRYRSDFSGDSWRVFLNSTRELWRNTHDAIRLLDAEGKTVDAITY